MLIMKKNKKNKKNQNRKMYFLTIGVVALLSGCSFSAEEEIVVDKTINTITMFAGGDSSANAYNTLLQSFMSQTDITVSDNSEIATNEWREKIINNMANNQSVPDVLFFFTGADVNSMILNNQIVSLEEIRKEYPDFAKNIRAAATNATKEFDGKHYAVPVKGFWEGLYCNTDMFLDYNLPLPTDWSSFISAIRKFNNNKVTPIAVSFNETPNYWIEHIILASGGANAHQLNPYTYTAETWVDGLQRLVDMYAIKSFSPDALENSNSMALESFLNKETAMYLDGSWSLEKINSNSETTVVLPIPTFNADADEPNTDIISGFSSGFYITRQAWENPSKREAVVEFVEYMTSDTAIAKFCENGGISASNIPTPITLSPLDTSIDTMQKEAVNSLMPIDNRVSMEAWNYLVDSIPALMLAEITPEEVLTRFAELNIW